jgi:hypothetical protein
MLPAFAVMALTKFAALFVEKSNKKFLLASK